MSILFREGQPPMFEVKIADYLNPDHEFWRARRLIDGDSVPGPLSVYYRPAGPSGKPICLMVGIYFPVKKLCRTDAEKRKKSVQRLTRMGGKRCEGIQEGKAALARGPSQQEPILIDVQLNHNFKP